MLLTFIIAALLCLPMLHNRIVIQMRMWKVKDGYESYRFITIFALTCIVTKFLWRAVLWFDYLFELGLIPTAETRWPVELVLGLTWDVMLYLAFRKYQQMNRDMSDA